MLLDGKAILDYLDELMDARHSLLRQNYNSVPPETLILHITQQLHILHDTLTQVYALYVDAGDGSDESQLESVQRKISPSNVESSNGSAHLQHFSSFEVGEKRHRLEAVSRHLHHFVKTFVEEERDRFRLMLADVKESVVLLELCSSVFTTLEFHQETWQQVVVPLSLREFDLRTNLFHPLFGRQCEIIVEATVLKFVRNLLASMKSHITRFLNNPRGPDWNVGNFTWSSSNASPIVFVSSAATAPMTPLMESFVREMVEEAGFAFANLNPLIPLIEHQSRIEDQSGITQSENTKTRSFNSLPLSWLNDATLLAPLFNLIQQEIAALPENFIADENDGGNSEFSVQKSLFVGKLVFQLLHHPSSPFTSHHRVRDDALPAQSPASTATHPPIQGTAFLMLQKLYWRSFDSWIAQQVNFFSFHCRNCLQSVEYWSQFTCLIHDMERTSLTNENNRDSISANAFVGTGTWEPISIPVTSPQPTDDNSTHGVDAADVRSIDRHLLPSHPSAWITTTLHHIASSIHAHFSSQLDRAYIMDKLVFRLGQEMVLSFYESFAVDLQTLSTSETVQPTLACKWSDKALLQILFDFGYLCSVFCVNDGKTETLRSPPLNSAVSSLSATLSPHDNSTLSPHKTATITPSELPRCVGDVLRQLQSVIDPIDYNLLRPFINANIGRALSRVDLLLSVLLDCVDRQRSGDAFASINSSPFATSAPVIAPPSTASSFLTEQHNIIPMFPSPSRFILLPTGQQQQSTSLAPTSPITSSFPSHSPSQRQSFHRVHRKSSTSSPRIDSSATTLPAITKSLFSPTIQVSTRSRRLSRGHLSSELSPAPSKLSGHHQINFLRVHKASHGENTKLPDSSHSFSPIIPTLASSSNVSSNNPLTSISSSIQSRLGILGSYF